MFGLDLTFGQKLQVAFMLIMFSIAGYLVFRSTRPAPDMTITSWSQQRFVGLDPAKPVNAANPADPARTSVVTIFANHDGHLEISEFPNDTEVKPTIVFKADQRRSSYNTYQSPTDRINAIKDPYKHTLTTAAYCFADGRIGMGVNLIARSGMTSDQSKSEKELQRDLLDQVDRIRQGAKTGMYLPELYDNVLRALADYKAKDGDPTKDPAKAALAHKVLDLAIQFINQQQKDETKLVDKYIDGVDALLSTDQKAKLAEAAKLAIVPRAAKPAKNRAAG